MSRSLQCRLFNLSWSGSIRDIVNLPVNILFIFSKATIIIDITVVLGYYNFSISRSLTDILVMFSRPYLWKIIVLLLIFLCIFSQNYTWESHKYITFHLTSYVLNKRVDWFIWPWAIFSAWKWLLWLENHGNYFTPLFKKPW